MKQKILRFLVITIGTVLIIYSGKKLLETAQFFRHGPPPIDHRQDPIQPWMNVAFLSKQTGMAQPDIFQVLEIPINLQDPNMPLGRLEKQMNLPRGSLLEKSKLLLPNQTPIPTYAQ